MKDEIFKIFLEILQVLSQCHILTQNLHSNSVSALFKGGLQWIAQTMQGQSTVQNYCCKNSHSILPDLVKFKPSFLHVLADYCYNTIAAMPDQRHRSEPCLAVLHAAVQCSDN